MVTVVMQVRIVVLRRQVSMMAGYCLKNLQLVVVHRQALLVLKMLVVVLLEWLHRQAVLV